MFDFWRKSTPFSSPGAVVTQRQTAIRIGDTSSLSLISILSEIVKEISTGSLEGRFESGISKEVIRLTDWRFLRGLSICTVGCWESFG